jgi:uncharacterized membrane protein YdjX (TVP38/TMEM64 family)
VHDPDHPADDTDEPRESWESAGQRRWLWRSDRGWPDSAGPTRSEASMRSGLIAIGLLSLVLTSCTRIPTPQEANDAVLTLRACESWAWAIGIALIWVDLVLPIPQTAVIAALGIIYGTLLGGLLGSIGLITGGLIGYALMRTSRRLAHRFAGPESLHRAQRLFDRGGAWAIILSHSLPEAVIFLAGLAGMPMRTFLAALTIGSVPTAYIFAAIGAGWADQPILALAASYVLPVALYLMRRGAKKEMPTPSAFSARSRWWGVRYPASSVTQSLGRAGMALPASGSSASGAGPRSVLSQAVGSNTPQRTRLMQGVSRALPV